MKNVRRIAAIVLAAALCLMLGACKTNTGVEDKVLTVAMECAYAPYNWAQPTDDNGAVPIKGSNLYANGYDVMTAKAICEYNGWELEIVQLDWDSLIPAVQSGIVDAVIAGQSMTSDRMEEVDFAGPYLYATIVCLARSDNAAANAKGISELSGKTCTSQSGTIWYDTCLPQINRADVRQPAETAAAMLMAVASGTVDFVCTDMPTAQGAVIAYPELKILDFAGSGDDFQVSDEEINIGISVKKGNTELKDAIDAYLKGKTVDDFNTLMNKAISVQPLSLSE
jgi:putative lysine transport system substrate-binding protein